MDFLTTAFDELRDQKSARTWANLWGRTAGAGAGVLYLSGAQDDYLPAFYDAALLGTRAAFGLFVTVLIIECLKWIAAKIGAARRASAGKKLLAATMSGSEIQRNLYTGWFGQDPMIKVPLDGSSSEVAVRAAETADAVELIRVEGKIAYYKVHPDLLFYLRHDKPTE